MKKIFMQLAPVVACSLVFAVFATAIAMYSHYNEINRNIKSEMDSLTSVIVSDTDRSLQEVYCLRSYVIGSGGVNLDLLADGEQLINGKFSEYINNILIAPDGVVSQVYPAEGNESSIGLNLYSTENESYEAAIEARDSGELVVTGPYNLVQGGQAISGRINVSVTQSDGTEKNWGLVSVTLKFPDIMQASISDTLNDPGFTYRISKYIDNTRDTETLFDNGFENDHSCQSVKFSISNMNFLLEAYSANPWSNAGSIILVFFGSFIALFSIVLIIRHFIRHSDSLKTRATTDELTGLTNRSSGQMLINRELNLQSFEKGMFLLCDIDHFKSVNDTLGHQKGDEVLRDTAHILTTVCRSADIVCRLGGDEFVVFMSHGEDRTFIDGKIKQLIGAMHRVVGNGNNKVEISTSIGIAFAPEHADSFDSLYKCADKALYKSKEDGRNRSTVYREDMTESEKKD